MRKTLFIIISLLFVNNLLLAGDKEDVIKLIKKQWVDFSNKTVDMSAINPNGTWQATSQGGLWEFLSPNDARHRSKDNRTRLIFHPVILRLPLWGKVRMWPIPIITLWE